MSNDSRRKEREQALYHGALRLVGQGADLRTVKMQQIADAAGMGKGTVYEYFPSKTELLRGLTRHCIEAEIASLEQALTPCNTLEETETALVGYMQQLVRDRAAIYRVVAHTAMNSGSDALPAMEDVPDFQRLQTLLRALLTRLRQNDELAPGLDDEYCIYAVLAAGISCTMSMIPCCPKSDAPPVLRDEALHYARQLLHRALAPLPRQK